MQLATRRDSPWLALILLTGVATVGFIDRIVLNVLVEPIKTEFGLSDTQMGLLTGLAFAVLNVTLGIFVARVAERRSRITLIAFGTFAWSIATALCGMVSNWIHLVLARVGVGVGEAVGLPANQSVVADYFPANKRATAMSVLLLAPPIGAFLGSAGGSWIAQDHGWRMAFLAAAVPGIVLSVLVFLFIAEPPRGRHDTGDTETVPSTMDVVRRFWRLKAARHLVIGSTLASLVGYGLNAFFAALMMRRFNLSLVEAGLYAGLLASAPATISVLAGGWLTDRFGPAHPAAYGLIPGICLLITFPLYAFAITLTQLVPLLVLVTIAALFQYAYLGCTYGTLQNMMHTRMRATASALLNALYSMVGAGLGPLVVGGLSDNFAGNGIDPGKALAWAMAAATLFYLWAAAHYLLAGRHLRGDMEAVREGRV